MERSEIYNHLGTLLIGGGLVAIAATANNPNHELIQNIANFCFAGSAPLYYKAEKARIKELNLYYQNDKK
jgi:hypothetical protein